MGIFNKAVEEHMEALFGRERSFSLKNKLDGKQPYERELLIIEELCQAFKEYGAKFILPFRFKNDRGNRTSHHLIFVSKHFCGYEIMKDIMARESSKNIQGVPSFEYNPADILSRQSLLFMLSRPLDDLEKDLMAKFAGQKLTMKEIYHTHNVNTPYIKKNYKDALSKLHMEDFIRAINSKGKPPRKGTFGDDIEVTFPKR